MKGLKIILWICAISCLMGFILSVSPWRAITTFNQWTGIQPPTADPTTVFLLRLFMMTVGMMGLFYLILACNPLKNDAMLLFAAYGFLIFSGIFYFVDGIRYGIPSWYCSLKAISAVVLGVLILIFRRKAIRSSTI